MENDLLEDFLASKSKRYLASIQEARTDYKEGRVYFHADVFEMTEILNDKNLLQRMKRGSKDAKNMRGRFVE